MVLSEFLGQISTDNVEQNSSCQFDERTQRDERVEVAPCLSHELLWAPSDASATILITPMTFPLWRGEMEVFVHLLHQMLKFITKTSHRLHLPRDRQMERGKDRERDIPDHVDVDVDVVDVDDVP